MQVRNVVVLVVILWAVQGSFSLQACSQVSPPKKASSVMQYGMTFTFDAQQTVGQYANGDYWVLGPITLVSTSPAFDGQHHGFEVDPDSIQQNGFDYRLDTFNASRVPKLPLKIIGPASIVKTVSVLPLNNTKCLPCLQTATVLTVVSAIPPDNGASQFRPGYFGSNKRFFGTASAQVANLPNLKPSKLAHPVDFSEVITQFQKVQLDHKADWPSEFLHPVDNMPAYGAYITIATGKAGIRLLEADVLTNTTHGHCALIMFLQAGIDWHSMLSNGMYWPANGGHEAGRKLPLTFAAWLFNDVEMKNNVINASGHELNKFQEDGEVYMGGTDSTKVLWGAQHEGGCNNENDYWTLVKTGDGNRICADPYRLIDGGPIPGDTYQFCCNSMPWKAGALAIHLIPEMKRIWNYVPYTLYEERWVTFGTWSQPDDCAPMSGKCTDASACSTAKPCKTGNCKYNDPDGKTFGPDGKGGCIKDTDSSDGIGRFPQLHGTHKNDGYYAIEYVDEMWTLFYK